MSHKPYRFRLYIVGGNVGSARADPDLRAVLEACLPGRFELEVIDLRENAERAEEDKVLAAPTVIRIAPAPERRAIGSMSDAAAVRDALSLPFPKGGAD